MCHLTFYSQFSGKAIGMSKVGPANCSLTDGLTSVIQSQIMTRDNKHFPVTKKKLAFEVAKLVLRSVQAIRVGAA